MWSLASTKAKYLLSVLHRYVVVVRTCPPAGGRKEYRGGGGSLASNAEQLGTHVAPHFQSQFSKEMLWVNFVGKSGMLFEEN